MGNRVADATMLRRLADALDRMGEMTEQTGVTHCAYGTDQVEIDGITLALQTLSDGAGVRYAVDLSSG
ncbi:hypothetical protein [Streptomyces sp. NPDC051310]|uniref:hypothetical protein n=1 Tax=Streptomyces sp. NPDC051310 TaxID=3365649 RepID=UPI0037BD4F18